MERNCTGQWPQPGPELPIPAGQYQIVVAQPGPKLPISAGQKQSGSLGSNFVSQQEGP